MHRGCDWGLKHFPSAFSILAKRARCLLGAAFQPGHMIQLVCLHSIIIASHQNTSITLLFPTNKGAVVCARVVRCQTVLFVLLSKQDKTLVLTRLEAYLNNTRQRIHTALCLTNLSIGGVGVAKELNFMSKATACYLPVLPR